MKYKTMTGTVFLALTLAVAGCGGGSSGPSKAEEMAMEKAEMEKKEKEDRMKMQMADLKKYADDLQMYLTALSGSATRKELDDAKEAVADLEKAIMAAMDVSAADKAMYQAKVADAAAPIKEAERVVMAAEDKVRMEEEEKKKMMAENEAKAMTATAKALKAALGMNPIGNTAAQLQHTDGIQVTARDIYDEDDDDDMEDFVLLPRAKPAGSAGMHRGWKGMRYAGTDDATKRTVEVLTYTTMDSPESEPFADWAGGLDTPLQVISGQTGADAWKNGRVLVSTGGSVGTGAALSEVMSDSFAHSGTQTHKRGDNEAEIRLRGTYAGAPGTYSCRTVAGCTSTNSGEGAPSALGGEWHFKPDAGAMVSVPDGDYLRYGWWVTKKDGTPTHASAFYTVLGTNAAALTDQDQLTGTATFQGGAAGKFAVYHDLHTDAQNKAGHFTADAELMADFGDATEAGTVKGTIDNFMLNDTEQAAWSVELKAVPVGTGGSLVSPTNDDAGTEGVDERLTTVWTIDGTAGDPSGTWSGGLYKYVEPDSGNTLPDAVLGQFQSMYGGTHGTHTLVGAFGAERED